MYRYITRKKGLYAAYSVLLLIASVAGIIYAFVLSEVINQAVAGNMRGLIRATVWGVVYIIAAVLCEYCYSRVQNRLLYYAKTSLKGDLFRSYFNKSSAEYENDNSAEYINEITNNVNTFAEVYFTNVLQLPMVFLEFVIAVALCIRIEPMMLLVIVAFSIVIAAVSKKCGEVLQKSTAAYAQGTGKYLAAVKDYLGGYRLIKNYHRDGAFIAMHEKENREIERLKEENGNDRAMYAKVNELLGLMSTLTIMGVAGVFAVKGSFEVGIVLAFGQLAGKIMMPIMSASGIFVQLKSAKTLGQGFARTLNREAGQKEKKEKKAELVTAITAQGLGFTYQSGKDEKAADKERSGKVLDGVNLTFRKGGKYLLTGPSGTGKSTFLHLLAGMYDTYEGSLAYDGVEVRDIEEGSLHSMVSVVSQDVFLFNDTLRNNITLFDDGYGDGEIWRAVRLAGLEKLAEGLSGEDGRGLDAVVSENGKNFSGGEKQRINLARAILRRSPVLLLDEFTASLDADTAREVERGVLDLEDVTVIFVTHRVCEELAGRYDGNYRIGF